LAASGTHHGQGPLGSVGAQIISSSGAASNGINITNAAIAQANQQ